MSYIYVISFFSRIYVHFHIEIYKLFRKILILTLKKKSSNFFFFLMSCLTINISFRNQDMGKTKISNYVYVFFFTMPSFILNKINIQSFKNIHYHKLLLQIQNFLQCLMFCLKIFNLNMKKQIAHAY